MTDLASHLPVIVIILPLLAAYLTPLFGYKWKGSCVPVALAALSLNVIFSYLLILQVMEHGPIHYYMGGLPPPWGIELVVDYLAAYLCVIISFVTLMDAIFSKDFILRTLGERRRVYYYTLFLLLTGGLLGASCTGDLFNFFVCFEVIAISSYALVAIAGDGKGVLGAYKYLFIGAIGSSLMLLGIGHLYINTGTLNMADMAVRLVPIYISGAILAGLSLCVVGFSIKAGLFPLHIWMPDAYAGAPATVPVLSTLVIKVGALALIRLLFCVFRPPFITEVIPVTTALTWLASAAIIICSIFAISQQDIRRMLAYSSAANIGYVILGIGIATPLGLEGGMLHMLNHSFTKACLFMAVGAIISMTGIYNIRDFGGLSKRMPITMGAFTLAALSMVGIPPSCGFMSKFFIAHAAIMSGTWIFAVVLLVSSLLNAIYFLRVVNTAYFGHPCDELKRSEAPLSMLVPMVIMAIGCVLLGVCVEVPLTVLRPAAQLLLGV